jgi:fatty acid desaturase
MGAVKASAKAPVARASVGACASVPPPARFETRRRRRDVTSHASGPIWIDRVPATAPLTVPSPLPSRAGARLRTSLAVPRAVRPAVARRAVAPRAAAVAYDDLVPSGLNGKAMEFPPKDEFPTRAEVLASIPEECFVKDTARSLMYAAISTAMTVGCGVLAYLYIPMQLAFWPVWLAYAAVTGTVATGCWVIAHECGHNAFSDNRAVQDTVGYILHSLLLVPYFSWQRSHAVHHSRTNHLTEGETHVPYVKGETKGTMNLNLLANIGEGPFAIVQLFAHLVFGWPAYLLTGATGGSARGVTNHFLPNVNTGPVELFPGSWKGKVWKSDIGVVAVVAGLCYWAANAGFATVAALYLGPYMFVNVWLVLYTWLQHTDTDVPHLEASEWSYIKGAFLTIDRPYGAVFDFLHHRIGSTHVAHHVECAIPHYHALKATEALKTTYPDLYLYDPTPIATALWRVASKCVAVEPRGEGKDKVWTFTDKKEPRVSPA